ncbi:MAG: purine-nucleoside phosphorylase [Oscillospiraceae bacterium]|nr:purine-nucleoside phosphorylase [Oscillospiraceae bacterium]
MPTPHISAKAGEFAKTVLMPGDPLRAKYIAVNYLENVRLVTEVRNVYGFTGEYKGKRVSVMGSGMGQPSIGIYSYELYSMYDVENIIRVGSAGSYQKDIHIRDIVIAQGACTNSNYLSQYNLNGTFSPIADWELLLNAYNKACELGINVHVGNVLSSDTFYEHDKEGFKKWAALGVLAVEMEAAALYANAAYLNKKALCILTISDSLVSEEVTTSEDREKTFTDMIRIALEIA